MNNEDDIFYDIDDFTGNDFTINDFNSNIGEDQLDILSLAATATIGIVGVVLGYSYLVVKNGGTAQANIEFGNLFKSDFKWESKDSDSSNSPSSFSSDRYRL